MRTWPLDVLPEADIERAARRFKEKHDVEGCWLRVKEDHASLDKVWIVRRRGKWKIDRW